MSIGFSESVLCHDLSKCADMSPHFFFRPWLSVNQVEPFRASLHASSRPVLMTGSMQTELHVSCVRFYELHDSRMLLRDAPLVIPFLPQVSCGGILCQHVFAVELAENKKTLN